MEFEAFAKEIFLALLARDPLAAQRFTEVDARIAQLIAFSQHIAIRWHKDWLDLPPLETVRAKAQRLWDYSAIEVPEVPVPTKLAGAAEADLFAS